MHRWHEPYGHHPAGEELGRDHRVGDDTVTNIRINTSCNTKAFDPTGPSPAPAGMTEARANPALPVLTVNPTSTGATCPRGPFTITRPHAERDDTFIATTGPVTLGPVGTASASCTMPPAPVAPPPTPGRWPRPLGGR